MTPEYVKKWKRCLDLIRSEIGSDRCSIWFEPAEAVGFERDIEKDINTLILSVPSAFFLEKYDNEFYPVLRSSIVKVFGSSTMVDYEYPVIGGDSGSRVNVGSSLETHAFESRLGKKVSDEKPGNNKKSRGNSTNFNPNLKRALNFENYCRGESNRLPFTIAESIANNPEKNDFNPFFLYGSVGVGKTHLSQAIGIRILENNPGAKVFYTSTRMFQNQYQEAALRKQVPAFINWFMQMDVLILDDLQELQGKRKTADDALFPVFNYLHQNGKQLIFTCDRRPSELEDIADRLIDRFKWGITEELARPDYDLRKKILTFKARKNGLTLTDSIIDEIARMATGSVRELEGIVMGMLTRSISTGAEINLALAREVMKNSIRKAEKKIINFEMILEATADYYNIKPEVIFSKSRIRDIADARQMIMYLAHKHTGMSSPAIGFKLNRIHSTVLHGIDTVEKRLDVSEEVQAAVAAIESDLFS